MKRWFLLLLFTFTTGTAHAQYMKGELAFSLGGGIHFPTGVFEDRVQNGSHWALGGGFFLNPSWYMGLNLGYDSFGPTATEMMASGLRELQYLNVDLVAQLMLYPESWFTPYILAGGGWYQQRIESSPGGMAMTDRGSSPGFTSGFGLNAHRRSSSFSLFTELVYHHIPSDFGSQQFVRWTSGLRISFGGRPF